MTKDQLADCLPFVREALAAATGGQIELLDNMVVVRIKCDVQALCERVIAATSPAGSSRSPGSAEATPPSGASTGR